MAPGILLGPTLEETRYYSESLKKRYRLDFSPVKPSNGCVAHIQFHPSLDQYLKRLKEAPGIRRAHNDVPLHWPRQINGSMSWRGRTLDQETRYVYHFTESDLEEIQAAVRHAQGELPQSSLIARSLRL